jgi:hypothetical protein
VETKNPRTSKSEGFCYVTIRYRIRLMKKHIIGDLSLYSIYSITL